MPGWVGGGGWSLPDIQGYAGEVYGDVPLVWVMFSHLVFIRVI